MKYLIKQTFFSIKHQLSKKNKEQLNWMPIYTWTSHTETLFVWHAITMSSATATSASTITNTTFPSKSTPHLYLRRLFCSSYSCMVLLMPANHHILVCLQSSNWNHASCLQNLNWNCTHLILIATLQVSAIKKKNHFQDLNHRCDSQSIFSLTFFLLVTDRKFNARMPKKSCRRLETPSFS